MENYAVGHDRFLERALRGASLEIPVTQPQRHGSRSEPIAAHVRRGARDEPQQLALDVFVRGEILSECFVAADSSVHRPMEDVPLPPLVTTVHPTPHPAGLP